MDCFISYSHKDEEYKNEFVKFCSQLIRNGDINLWHDRAMTVGSKMDSEIKERIEKSSIVVIFLSQDFINSYYCYEVEFSEAIKRHNGKECRLFPVVVRHCDWKSTPINPILIQNDAQPVSECSDKDKYWLFVKDELVRVINEINDGKNDVEMAVPCSDYLSDLKKTYINFSGKGKSDINLPDIYVWPDLKPANVNVKDIGIICSSKEILINNKWEKKLFVCGSEQSGKTALCQTLCSEFIKVGKAALLIDGKDIQGKKASQKVQDRFCEIFQGGYRNHDKILVVDDFDKTSLNFDFRKKFIDEVSSYFDRVIITMSDDLSVSNTLINKFSEASVFEILGFSKRLRSELINKWHSLGVEEVISEQELESLHDKSEQIVESIIIRNVFPAKPFFLLMILQIGDAGLSFDKGMTSYGHCYHKIIVQQLERAGVKAKDIDSHINFLCEMSYYIYKSNKVSLELREFEQFCTLYQENFFKDPISLKDNLLEAKIIDVINNSNIRVSYKYILYYSAGKKIASDLDNGNYFDVDNLCSKLHVEKFANILIFVTHHTRSKDVIDHITLKVMEIFENEKEAEFSEADFDFLTEFSKDIPEIILENRDVKNERSRFINKIDNDEKNEIVHGADRDDNSEEDNDLEMVNKFLENATKAYRATEILGQIIRTRKGSMKKDMLLQLADEGVSVALRFLRYFLVVNESLKDEIINEVRNVLTNKGMDFNSDEAKKLARKFFWFMCFMMSYAVIKRCASVLSSDDSVEIFEALSKDLKKSDRYSFAREICDIAMIMQHKKNIPKKEIENLVKRLENYPITKRILQEVVVNHIYMNTIEIRDKQWVSTTLGIPVQSQMLIDMRTRR